MVIQPRLWSTCKTGDERNYQWWKIGVIVIPTITIVWAENTSRFLPLVNNLWLSLVNLWLPTSWHWLPINRPFMVSKQPLLQCTIGTKKKVKIVSASMVWPSAKTKLVIELWHRFPVWITHFSRLYRRYNEGTAKYHINMTPEIAQISVT